MAAPNPFRALEDELSCPICLDYFKDPVLLCCGHNFCQACITMVWEGLEGHVSCPQCRKRFQGKSFQPNTLLGAVVEKAQLVVSQAGNERPAAGTCQKHGEALHLYCQEDQALICVVCDRSQEHRAHAVVPREEATQEYKEKLHKHLESLKGEKQSREALTISEGRRIDGVQARVKAERQRVTSTFQQLHQLLQEKEQPLLEGLDSMAQSLRQLHQENMASLQQEVLVLHGLITELERRCQLPDLELLKDARSTLSRYKMPTFRRWDPVPTDSLEETVRHISCKRCALWAEMTQSKEILTLDASSAHPGLVVAPDRRSVRHGKKVLCSQPRDPQRFFPAFCILGSEGFSSGQHIWEVRVEGKDGWAVGVAKESVRRQGPMGLLPQNGVWAVELGRYKLLPFGPARPQEGPECRLSRIQVCLDYEEGRVTFANSEDQALLFTFRASFTERIFPFFWLWSHHAQITLCP
ncbi:E3 ubiquitin-protein ligase TRIM39 isoform X1 [Alligator mississippiensis]|uniref:E3 ubiquitin-protein ligase TRIM39 isoform X1 n=1 Tax=Alligator mississippiensis TaxID=8496 RepID=UPI0007118160|nr:E3 ubiquitin-protein ligase TRIM39 isoform X1 [Alligator mississippiensis]